jgi:hypothetical protein
MKKLLAPFLILAVVLTFAKIGFALTAPPTTTPGEKQSLVDGDMEATNAAVALTDGDMETAGTGSWNPYNAVISKQTGTPHGGSQVLRVAYDGADAWGDGGQNILTVGHVYRVTGWARGDGTSAPGVILGGGGTEWNGTNSSSWQQIDYTGTCLASGVFALFSANLSATHYVEFDDIAIVDVTAGSWTASGATVSKQTNSPHGGRQVLRVAGAQYAASYQTVLTIGKRYRMRGWARGDGGSGQPAIGGLATAFYGTTSNVWQYFDITSVAVSESLVLYQWANATAYAEFDDISVTEYKGFTQVQDSQIITDGDMEGLPVTLTDSAMEAADTSAWTAGASGATLSKQVGTLSGVGVKKLRVANPGASGFAFPSPTVVTIGRTYRITGWAAGDGGGGSPSIRQGSGAWVWTGTNSTVGQRFDIIITADSAATPLLNNNGGAGTYAEFDDLSITDVGTTAYTAGNNAVLSKVTSSHGGKYALRVAHNGTDNPIAIPTATPIEGKRYHLTGWARGDGAGGTPVVKNGNTVNAWVGTNSNTWQRIDVIYTQGVGNYYYFRMIGSSGYVEFDDMMSTEYKGEIGVIEKQLAADGDMELTGTASWTALNAALTKATTSPHSGSKVLRLTYTDNAYIQAYQTILTLGKKYRLKGCARSDGTTVPSVYIGGNAASWTGTASAGVWQCFDTTRVADGTGLWIIAWNAAAANYVEYDDIYITQVP